MIQLILTKKKKKLETNKFDVYNLGLIKDDTLIQGSKDNSFLRLSKKKEEHIVSPQNFKTLK